MMKTMRGFLEPSSEVRIGAVCCWKLQTRRLLWTSSPSCCDLEWALDKLREVGDFRDPQSDFPGYAFSLNPVSSCSLSYVETKNIFCPKVEDERESRARIRVG
ncbi:hypothetical protein U1Q18_013723 [Sarracenia purpurea var. burkii]